jgi:hypothetical protein
MSVTAPIAAVTTDIGLVGDVRIADIKRGPECLHLGCLCTSPDNEFELGPKAVDTFKLLKTLVHFVPRF